MLKEKLKSDLIESMKSGNKLEAEVLRMIISSVANKEIEKKKKESGLNDEEIIGVLSTELKKRKDAALQFESGGRAELVKRELEEAEVIKKYLPQELSEEELRSIIAAEKSKGTISLKDFGKSMGQIMTKVKTRASGDLVSKILKEELSKNNN